MHLLLVDNNNISQRIILNMVKDSYDITTVSTLSEAKINISRGSFDALLISGDGDVSEYFSYTYDLRRPESPMATKPILLLAAHYTEDLAYRAWRSGVNQTFAKPMQKDVFLKALAEQIKQPSAPAISRNACTVELVAWSKGDLYYLYSPDLERHVTAYSKEDAEIQMNLLFEQFWYRFEQSRFGEAHVHIQSQRLTFAGWQSDDHIQFTHGENETSGVTAIRVGTKINNGVTGPNP